MQKGREGLSLNNSFEFFERMTNLGEGGTNVLSLFHYIAQVFFYSILSFLICHFLGLFPFNDIHCQLLGEINIVHKYVV